jgi:formate dehydrogenase maturation protein FdhE
VAAGRNLALDLHAEAEARWADLLRHRPDLAPAIDLQRTLLSRQISLLTNVRTRTGWDPIPAGVLPLHAFATAARRIPAADTLAPAILEFCSDLANGGAGDAAGHVRAALSEERLDAESLLRASLRRDERGIREGAARTGLSADLLWLVGELAAAPLAHALAIEHARVLMREAEGGSCAFCGSRPALAEITPDARRTLRCSFCATAWTPARVSCACCGTTGQNFGVSTLEMDSRHALELCRACGSYLKLVRVEAPAPFPLVAIADLATSDLDVAATERGFTRPPLGDPAA